ncbi:MAG: hypothetical protein QM811_18125 [Pirellulales bacterium]
MFAGSTSYTATYDLTTNPFIVNSLQFNNSSVGGVTMATSTNAISARHHAEFVAKRLGRGRDHRSAGNQRGLRHDRRHRNRRVDADASGGRLARVPGTR